MIRCTYCSTLNRDTAQFCVQCGASLTATPHLQVSPGSVLHNRYKITSIVAHGGMGRTYLAQDTNLANRECVVKEMLDQFTDLQERAEAIRGFQQEADILSRLRHDNIPQIYDRFSEGGKHYLVMEFVDGEDLDKIIESRSAPLPEKQVIDWAIQLCKVLDYLHNRTPPIIYRDLKPSNIMLTRDGKIKLIDFGIARLLKKGKAKDTEALGTVGYSPLEQWGKGQTDARSDIYALGATMHYLLTKKNPRDFPPFSFDQRLPRASNPNISEGMEMIIMKAVEHDRSRRYQSARQLLHDLENLKQGIGPAPLGVICPHCSAINKATAKFCNKCGAVLPVVSAPPLPPPAVPCPPSPPLAVPYLPLPRSWTIRLSASLDEAKARLFYGSREGLVNNIVGAVLKEDVGITGITIMLRGIEGFGGTSIATRVKDDILSSKSAVTLVATLDFSDPRHLAEPSRTLEEILMALRRSSGSIGRKLRNAVREAYRRQMKAKRPVTREIETQRRTSLTPFPVSLEVVTPWGKASLGSPFARESQVSEREVSEPLDAEQWLLDLLDALRDLVDYLLLEGVRVILIFDKVRDIGVLNPLVPIVSRGGVYSIVIANMDDYADWRRQNPDLLKRFSKKDFYAPCVWNLPQQLCKDLTRDRSEADSREFYFLHRFLEYHGRGVPDRTIKAIERFYSPPIRSTGNIGWLKRLLLLEVERPARISVSETQWPEITRCVDLQQRLEAGWSEIFDPQQGIPSFDSLTEETADRARMAIYTLTDWLLIQAEKGVKVSKRALTDHALAKCKMPFDERVSKRVVAQFITFLVLENKATPTSRGLDLSGLLTTSPLSDRPKSANRLWGSVGCFIIP